jgi:DNA repair exonuclease SbcCD ATPase subunit
MLSSFLTIKTITQKMKLQLKKLNISNFKGGKFEIDFSEITNIYGKNRCGKTRVFDAFSWLLFGKDSAGQTDFDIKPLDEDNNVIHNVDVEVEGIFDIDGTTVTLMKVYKEKWTKKRGASAPVLTSHTTTHYVDGLDVSKKEYEDYIYSVVDLEIFRLLTNPLYFQSLNWTEKRKILFSLVQEKSDEELAGDNKDFLDLLVQLKGRPMVDYKKRLNTSRRKKLDELKLIPSRIDEVERGKPEVIVTESTLMKSIKEVKAAIKQKEAELNKDTEAFNEIKRKRAEVYGYIAEVETSIEVVIKTLKSADEAVKLKTTKAELQQILSDTIKSVESYKKRIVSLEKTIADHELAMNKLREQWAAVQTEKFNEKVDTECPVCKQPLPEGDIDKKIDQLAKNFNTVKGERLSDIQHEGHNLKSEVERHKEAVIEYQDSIKGENDIIEKINTDIEAIDKQLSAPTENIEDIIASNPQIIAANKKIAVLKKSLPPLNESDDSIKEELKVLRANLAELEKDLEKHEQIKRSDERIKELNDSKKQLIKEIDELERKEFNIDEFLKVKVSETEAAINSLFSFVKFKMYKQLVNGDDEPTCITLINGVSYNSTNNEAKINSGLDIINTLSKHYDKYFPVFVDNREGVSEIVDMNTQIINLIVSAGDLKLRVEKER